MEIVKTDTAPAAIGPYSQAVKSTGLVFCSGQIPLRPDGTLVEGDAAVQARQVLENLKNVLIAAGSSLEKVVRATMYLDDLEDFALVNGVYETYFSHDNKPARVTIEVSRLPKNAKVEIDCIAEL